MTKQESMDISDAMLSLSNIPDGSPTRAIWTRLIDSLKSKDEELERLRGLGAAQRPIMEFRCSTSALELALDEDGDGMYVITLVHGYNGEKQSKNEEARIASTSLAVSTFSHLCDELSEKWLAGVCG